MSKPFDRPELLSYHEVAARLGCTVMTVRNRMAAGTVPLPVRVGGNIGWERAHFERWFQAGCWPVVRWVPAEPEEAAGQLVGVPD